MAMQWIVRILIAVSVSVATFVGLNLRDDPPNPEIATVLTRPYVIPPRAIEGFIMYLGLNAPPDQDPVEYGTAIYQDLEAGKPLPKEAREWSPDLTDGSGKWLDVRGSYLNKDDLAKHRAALELAVFKNRLLLERFDRLLEIGALSPGNHVNMIGMAPLAPMLSLTRLKLAEAELLLHTGRVREAKQLADRIFSFHRESIYGHKTMLEVVIHTAALKGTRTFVEDAARDLPEFRALLGKNTGAYSAMLDTSRLIEGAMQTELEWLAHALQAPLDQSRLTGSWPTIALLQAQRTPNRVINGNYRCWKGAEKNLGFTIYPVAQSLVNTFCGMIPGMTKKLELNASILREPLAMNE